MSTKNANDFMVAIWISGATIIAPTAARNFTNRQSSVLVAELGLERKGKESDESLPILQIRMETPQAKLNEVE